MNADASVRISVVVCSHNGERSLPATLSHLRRQSLGSSSYEVIVVDDGSADDTSAVARAAGARLVRLGSPQGLAAARNAGVSACTGELVAFTDDDCEPARGWLAALVSAFADDRLDGVGGCVEPACSNPLLLRYLRERNPLTPLPAELLGAADPAHRLRRYLRGALGAAPQLAEGARLYSPVGANMAFRRRLIFELGGFDEAFTFGGEEEELCRRGHRRAQGLELRYAPAACVVHRFDPRVRDMIRRARAYGRGHARMARKHPELRPIVYPFPLITAIAAVAGSLTSRRGLLGVGALVPVAAYARWPRAAWRTRSPAALAFPYLDLAAELSTMLGELEGHRAGYASVPARRLVDT